MYVCRIKDVAYFFFFFILCSMLILNKWLRYNCRIADAEILLKAAVLSALTLLWKQHEKDDGRRMYHLNISHWGRASCKTMAEATTPRLQERRAESTYICSFESHHQLESTHPKILETNRHVVLTFLLLAAGLKTFLSSILPDTATHRDPPIPKEENFAKRMTQHNSGM